MASAKFLSLLALAGVVAAADMPIISIKGSKFFYPNGTQFFMKGVAYQQGVGQAGSGATADGSSYLDPLADEARCKNDIPLLASLGTNVIRTYAIDPTKDHSACMKLLQDNNIYIVSDLSEPTTSINRDDPSWDVTLYKRYTSVVDTLSQYPNVIGFFAGNEVANQLNNTASSAFVKAAVRDTKAYIKAKKYRTSLGVGYAANDDQDIVENLADYFNCGDASSAIDFFGYNIYSWCGSTATYEAAGYNRIMNFFQNYSVPVFFAEYGCNKPDGAAGRTWTDTAALYSANMSKVFSGGIVYEFFQEDNDYGLYKAAGSSGSKLKDFDPLAKAVAKASPQGVDMNSYSSSAKAASCPAVNGKWGAKDTLPPTPNDNACSCMYNASSCVPAANLKASSYGKIFDYIGANQPSALDAIAANGTTGKYGQYAGCDAKSKLAIALTAYYKALKSDPSACKFDGSAVLQTANTAGDCSKQTPSNGAGTASSGGSSGSSGDKNAGIKTYSVSAVVALAALAAAF
ncbi:hypothetical protein VHEMI08165 [[Torrubiella] hemipterigena]|uniref:1,3-beta-glucanosyltransferase n=1 Tax=[Torrubiella] hemipterigena TaxID=1531966 RepID=A0A0A1TMP9_9HYPO|nr:hypothetical protein VHEMI08165 [[Torrubiella] hemipterigena]